MAEYISNIHQVLPEGLEVAVTLRDGRTAGLQIRISHGEILQLAEKASRNKGQQAHDGPVTVSIKSLSGPEPR